MKKTRVAILMGSDSDLPVIQKAAEVLKEFGVGYRMTVASQYGNRLAVPSGSTMTSSVTKTKPSVPTCVRHRPPL